MKQYSGLNIASYFINKNVNILRLQKLLYYSQLWYFKKYGKKLFQEKIEAWIYGPVVKSVWYEYRYMRVGFPIPERRAFNTNFDKETLEHLNDVWNAYGHLNASQLVSLTHSELPWLQSRSGLLKSEPSGREVKINKNTTSLFSLTENNTIPVMHKNIPLGHYSNRK